MKRLAPIALLAFLAVVGGAEWLARRALPVVPRADTVPRNPYRFRGWPEFTEMPPAETGVAQVVLISNSQGYSGETPANRIYPDKLERMLTERRAAGFRAWQVLNWSFDGVTSMEYLLMAARLRDAHPDLVVAAVGMADFSDFNLDRPLSRCRTDLPRLAARPAIAARLPASFVRRHFKVEDVLTAGMWDRFALLRSRDYLWSRLDQTWAGLQPGLYAPFVNYHPWELDRRARVDLGRAPWRRASKREVKYTSAARPLVAEFLDQLRQVPARRILVCTIPNGVGARDPIRPDLDRFREDLASLCAERGLTFWALDDALPAEDYLDSLHFTPPNQQRFAEYLAERLPPLLEP